MNANPNPYRGLIAVRYLKAVAVAKGDLVAAHAYASGQNWQRTTPQVEKALAEAIGTDSGLALADAGFDYVEFVRPFSVLGRLQTRRVPFNTRMLLMTGGTSANWVGERQPKPVSAAELDGTTLPALKVAGISVVSQELVNSSAPSAETALSTDIGRAGAQAIDQAFLDPANAGISGVKPASVTNGSTPISSSGSALSDTDRDLSAALNALAEAGSDLQAAVWVMNPRTAISLAKLRASGGNPAYPLVGARGGSLLGVPVITSGNVQISEPTGDATFIALLDPQGIAVADDNEARLRASTQASLQMESDPASGATTQISLWQRNLVALLAERTVNWILTREGFAQVITEVQY